MRMGWLMGMYADALTQGLNFSWEQAQHEVHSWCIFFEQAFADLLAESGRGERDDGAISSFFEKVGDYGEKVQKAYELLAHDLGEFAMTECGITTDANSMASDCGEAGRPA